ncbi:NAD(P)-dependent oxidoreductase [Paenibacillus barcinonensis]|uniref:NAD(P)-dependent oxidoreductase n=1 Tax=Paenibacillus barcinonensis TaxID=198119 RepID=UPI001C0FECA4|nr:NAD(P)-dependent oxidoreductase [Paenibacillus barcinonensis]MBU5352645.1 NAD(P)-dependent oxidoreductase [Paenibacillus barcinonensis]
MNHSGAAGSDYGWESRFVEMKPAMTGKEAMEESNRCLYCYDAPCIKACPTDINIPSFIKKIATGHLKGSARTIMDANPIGASCARVCPTEELCEGACVLNESSKPIRIGDLQRYATDWARESNEPLFHAAPANGRSIAVVGAGPAGLSAARELGRAGYEVTIYEAKAKGGGLNTYGIVSFRLPEQVPLWEVEQVEALGVQIRYGVRIGIDMAASELLERHEAVILACGMGSVPMLGIEGETLEGVYDAIELVESTKQGVPPALHGLNVAVIGAGNTAVDAATCSVRLGAERVQMLYRRGVQQMTAYAFEYTFAKQEGVEFRWFTMPQRILGDENGRVRAVECVKMELVTPPGGGRALPAVVEGSTFIVECDTVIRAIGQNRLLPIIEAFELRHNGGVVEVETHTYRTSHPQVYAAGDVVFGQGQGEAMVVSAAQQGKLAAAAIMKALPGCTVESA